MNLRWIGDDFGGLDFIFRKFHQYLEGFVLRSMMSDFKKCIKNEGSRRGYWWILGGLESLLVESGSFRITQASLLDLWGVLSDAHFSSRSF